jgi:hypothetical protein
MFSFWNVYGENEKEYSATVDSTECYSEEKRTRTKNKNKNKERNIGLGNYRRFKMCVGTTFAHKRLSLGRYS